MRVYTMLLPALCLLAAASAGAETPTLDAIRATVAKAWQDVESLSGDVTTDFVMPFANDPLSLTGTGEVHFLREDGKNKYRKKWTAKLPRPFATEMKLDVLYDGKTLYTTTELMGQAQKREGEPSLRQGALPPGGAELLAALEDELVLTVLPNGTVNGHEVFVLEGRPEEGDTPVPFAKVVFYIDKKLGIQRKMEIHQPDGTIGIAEVVTNIRVSSSPDASLFEPEG